jgi:hypothetical protein
MDKELVQQLLTDLCDSVLGNVDFESREEEFGGILTLLYIRKNNQELIDQLNEWSKQ